MGITHFLSYPVSRLQIGRSDLDPRFRDRVGLLSASKLSKA